jgi:hypothetical protein
MVITLAGKVLQNLISDLKRTYLTSKINSLFHAKSKFKRDSEGTKKRLPIKSDEESSLVAGTVPIAIGRTCDLCVTNPQKLFKIKRVSS